MLFNKSLFTYLKIIAAVYRYGHERPSAVSRYIPTFVGA